MEKMENHKNHIVWKLQQILLNRINIKNGNNIKFKDYSIIDQIITFPD